MMPNKKNIIVVGVVAVLLAGFTLKSEASSKKETTSPIKKIEKADKLSSSSLSSKETKKKKKLSKLPRLPALKKPEEKGFCCAGGTFYSKITKTACKRENGRYAGTEDPLKDNCGWCCKTGRVRSVSSSGEKIKLCGDPKVLYNSQGEAEKNCGWCCKGLKVSAVTARNQCRPKQFHLEKVAAEKQCKPKPLMGSCNYKDKTIKTISKKRCEKLGGKFYKRFALAQNALVQTRKKLRNLDNQKKHVWCCKDGKVSLIPIRDCVGTEQKPLNGKAFVSKLQADKACSIDESQNEQIGWCCNKDGKTIKTTKIKCVGTKEKPLDGKFFKTKADAVKACSKFGLGRPAFPRGTFKKPHRLPDLEVVRTSYNRQCLMTVTVKNNGGPISSASHGASTIHLSAGPGNISTKTKLADIDPDGDLRSPGVEITKKIDDVRITVPSQATLVWVDTNHQIVESDETNNGDDQVLTCKIPLFWCCVKNPFSVAGRGSFVGQVTKGECKTAGGTTYDSEEQANKACGIKSSILSKSGEIEEDSSDAGKKRKSDKVLPQAKKKETVFEWTQKDIGRSPVDRRDERMMWELPDLLVSSVWVDEDRGCQIWLKVKNQGGGAISDADHARGKISFVTGSGTDWERPLPPEKRYLSVIDPTGLLKEPGGEVSYNTGLLAVVPNQWYTAMVDNTFQITEDDEGNNQRIGTFKQFCKGTSFLRPLSGTDTSTWPMLLPDLKVADPWTDERCNLWIKVQNVGPGSIDPDDHRAAEVSVTASTPYRELPGDRMYLHVVDPTGNLLSPGGESEPYNTGIVIDDSDNVSVYVDQWNTIAEVDDRANNQYYGSRSCTPIGSHPGVRRLGRELKKMRQPGGMGPIPAKQQKTDKSDPEQADNKKKKSKMGRDTKLLRAHKDLHLERVERRDEGPADYFWPIIISPPNSSSVYTAGDTIQGRFRIEISEEYAETVGDVEIGSGQIHFALMAGWDPHIPPFAETTVTYTPPTKDTSRYPASTLRIFSLPIPPDLSHSSNYRIIGYHEGSHWSVMGTSDPFTIRPLIEEEDRGTMKKRDGSGRMEEMIPAPEMSAQQVIPVDSDDHTVAQAPARPGPEYPATITSVNCPIIPGNTMTIDGNDFGERQGRVDIILPDSSSHPCSISSWGDNQVQCLIPRELGDAVGRSSVDAVVWLKPAVVLRPPGTPDDSDTYYYNGEEGPRYVCTINPLEADCRGVDLVLNQIEVRRSGSSDCVAKVWISQACEGETTVDSFFSIFSDRGETPAGWTIPAGWSGPSGRAHESGWLILPCGTITGRADYNSVEDEVNEGNNDCSVTIRGEMETATRTCNPF